MDKQQSSKNNLLTMESLNSIPLISIMENSPVPWGVKNIHSRHVYINRAAHAFLSLPESFSIEGRADVECPAHWSEFYREWYAQDRQTEKKAGGTAVIATSYYNNGQVLEPYYTPKFAIYNNAKECIGTLWYVKKFNFHSLWEYFSNLKPSVLTLNPPNDDFTESELDIIFFALQSLTTKQIALRMELSQGVVENRLHMVYQKVGVTSFEGLAEYCRNEGFNRYIPHKFIRAGVDFI